MGGRSDGRGCWHTWHGPMTRTPHPQPPANPSPPSSLHPPPPVARRPSDTFRPGDGATVPTLREPTAQNRALPSYQANMTRLPSNLLDHFVLKSMDRLNLITSAPHNSLLNVKLDSNKISIPRPTQLNEVQFRTEFVVSVTNISN